MSRTAALREKPDSPVYLWNGIRYVSFRFQVAAKQKVAWVISKSTTDRMNHTHSNTSGLADENKDIPSALAFQREAGSVFVPLERGYQRGGG